MNQYKIQKAFLVFALIILLSSCGSGLEDTGTDVGDSLGGTGQVEVYKVVAGDTQITVPTLVVLMNWNDYSEDDANVWHDKIFDASQASVNRWYADSTHSKIQLSPINENQGTSNDGVISVPMGKNRPDRITADGRDYDFVSFVSTDITDAITSNTVTSNVDFSLFDKDSNGIIDYSELQIIFIVAGGEMSYGDTKDALWAHSWNYENATVNAPLINGVKLMYATGDANTSGSYGAFGSIHGNGTASKHEASIGIIAHEVGHSMLNLIDLYDTSYTGAGIGYFDIMGGGTWAKGDADSYDGDSPTQFGVYSKFEVMPSRVTTVVDNPSSVTLKCSDTELLKLTTTLPNEYFLIGCRDTQRSISDAGFMSADTTFTTDRLFSILYHVDSNKENNSEGGNQTLGNHYKVAIVQKSYKTTMATQPGLRANFEDVFTVGSTMDTTHTKLYTGSNSGYIVKVVSEDTEARTMTFSIQI